jgi:hypothetical protein
VGGENFSSGGTSGCVEGEGCATSSVGWKSGTNFALERNFRREKKIFLNLWIKAEHSTNVCRSINLRKNNSTCEISSHKRMRREQTFIYSVLSTGAVVELNVEGGDNLWSPLRSFFRRLKK